MQRIPLCVVCVLNSFYGGRVYGVRVSQLALQMVIFNTNRPVPVAIKYRPQAIPGTTYDTVFENTTSSGDPVYMPPAFALVMSIASGLTHGLIEWSIL